MLFAAIKSILSKFKHNAVTISVNVNKWLQQQKSLNVKAPFLLYAQHIYYMRVSIRNFRNF